MGQLFCGTSGFAFPSWKPEFYPAKLPAKDFLKHYAGRLNAVEINYTFRRLPAASTLQTWVEATSEQFRFAVRAHQRITHIHRLKESESTGIFFKAIDPLRSTRRLGPILFQLPPNFKCDEALLESFLAKLPDDELFAFEFRNTSWLKDSVYRLLEKAGASLCLAESERLEIPRVITAGFVYSRLRKEEYSPEDMRDIADRTKDLLDSGRDFYVFFKHEETPAGAFYAEQLLRSVGKSAAASGV
jgi:uncharacterized protein YecE (DUF72 family)